ncbi:Replication factor C subunit 3 [Citrus sinensis]|uniref:Replication factor C subunit 3 n=1 Tax=Citrus sinensis TaxID=2711 RepID=A0ACB8MFW7_CITSI|nr:Replication factor C subunit 3 [Citrus sinensis]
MFCLRCGIEIILKVSRCICCNYLIFPATSALALLSLRVTEQDCPHLLFYGPPGSGKKTLIMALLRQVFGPGAEKAGSRNIDLELTTLSSANHVELSPSDAGFQDRYVVREVIKEMAKNRPIDTKGKRGFKVLVLNEVDKLSREAQHSLRRTMEKYSASCRLILCCNSSSKVTEAIRSRCLNIRINSPTEEQIVKVLEFIAKKEGLQLPSGFATRLAEKSNRSLRRAILSFETCRVQQLRFTMPSVRGKLYELLLNCVPPVVVLKRLLYELLKRLDAEIKHEVCHWAAYYVSISFQILFIVPLVDFPSPLECSAQAAYIQPPLIRANSDPVALHS